MAKTPTSLDLQAFLPYRLSIVTNKVSRNLATMYSEKFDLSIAEWRVMAVLGQSRDLSAEQVCELTETDKVTVSRAVTKLLNKQYIIRKFSNTDRRRSILRLSRSGYSVYAQVVPMAKKYEMDLSSCLSKQELSQLDGLLNKLKKQAMLLSEK